MNIALIYLFRYIYGVCYSLLQFVNQMAISLFSWPVRYLNRVDSRILH